MRAMCAAMLSLEAIILALAVPVMIAVEDVSKPVALSLGLGLAVLCLLTAGALRRPEAYYVGHLIQVGAICLGFLVPVMFFVGAMFAALWLGAFFLGRRIESDKARWAAEADDSGMVEVRPVADQASDEGPVHRHRDRHPGHHRPRSQRTHSMIDCTTCAQAIPISAVQTSNWWRASWVSKC